MQWILKSFDALTLTELYNILQLRSRVFVVEQNCAYLDQDGKDARCYHLMGMEGDALAAYCRILPAGLAFQEASIGRVVSSPDFRGKGQGKLLMQKALEQTKQLYGNVPVRIGAQYYLFNFYSALGFKQVSDIYLEDDIQHIEMLIDSL